MKRSNRPMFTAAAVPAAALFVAVLAFTSTP
jgi:hypothetical protein